MIAVGYTNLVTLLSVTTKSRNYAVGTACRSPSRPAAEFAGNTSDGANCPFKLLNVGSAFLKVIRSGAYMADKSCRKTRSNPRHLPFGGEKEPQTRIRPCRRRAVFRDKKLRFEKPLLKNTTTVIIDCISRKTWGNFLKRSIFQVATFLIKLSLSLPFESPPKNCTNHPFISGCWLPKFLLVPNEEKLFSTAKKVWIFCSEKNYYAGCHRSVSHEPSWRLINDRWKIQQDLSLAVHFMQL